jgi:Rod binding domain-containing protein
MVGAVTSAIPQAPDQAKPRNAPEAAKQFEALLLAQMLRTAHGEEEQEDQTGDTMWDMAAQQFAQVMAENGGMGLAKLVTQGLRE